MKLVIVQFFSGNYYFRFDRSHPVVLHKDKAICSVKKKHKYVSNQHFKTARFIVLITDICCILTE